jgi:signal peptidase I
MIPALRPGEWYWASKPKSLSRGDFVVIEKTGFLVKRIAGLPGESVTLPTGRPSTLAPEMYWVLGDAREDSLDSRKLGPIARKEIRGVLKRRLWPWR